jgi:aminoglycoside phosphotransferase (APT) family kinase protein
MTGESLPDDLNIIQPYLLRLLSSILGTRVHIVDMTTANQRLDYRVLIVRLAHPPLTVTVKLAGPAAPYPCPFERTASIHALVRAQTSIPLPEVLAADTTCSHFPWRYMVKTYAPGQQWIDIMPGMTCEQRTDVYAQLGAAVAELGSIHFDGFGYLEDDGSLQQKQTLIDALAERAAVFIHDPRLRDDFLKILYERQNWLTDVREASLVHEDLHCYNILYDQRAGRWLLSAILDFDKAWAGHHEIDLARLELWNGMTAPAFWRAYAEQRTLDPLFEQRKLLYQLQWCYEFPHKDAEHLALTASIRSALGV